MSTSPGGRGGAGVLEAASKRFPFHGGNVVETFLFLSLMITLIKPLRKISNEEKDSELKEKN